MKHFTLKELTQSDTALRRDINNTPGVVEIANLTALADNVLDPLREAYGKPIRVNSGYRSEALNSAVGGSKNSQHLRGEAADLTTGSTYGNKWLFNYVIEHLPFDQLINENNYSWIHLSYKRDGKNRRQILKL